MLPRRDVLAEVLVTGGSGFIGTNLIRRLVERGEKVRVLLRNPVPHAGLQGLPIEIVKGDILDDGSVRLAMQGIERVYHVAGYVNLGPFQAKQLRAINVVGTEIVCRAALAAGVRRVVHTSTVSTMGQGSRQHPADETSVFDHAQLEIPYFITKRDGELAALRSGESGPMEVVVVNPAFVLGAFDVKPTSGELILWAVKSGGLPFYAKGSLNAVDVDDVVDGHIAAMERGRPGERYILGNENLSHQELLVAIADELGLRRPLMPIWNAGARPFTIWGDMLGPLFPRTFDKLNTHMLKVMDLEHYVTCEKARRELGLPQTPVRTAIRKAYDWFVSAGRLAPRPGRKNLR